MEAAAYQLCSGTYNHTHIPSLSQEHRKTYSQRTPGWWLQERHVTPQLGWERSTGTAAGGEGSAGKWSGQTTPDCENSPEDIGVTFRAQPQPLSSLPVHPWTTFTCPISLPAKEDDIIFFLPSLPVFSICLGGLSSSPQHTEHQVQRGIDGATAEVERVTVRYSPSALT